MVELSTRRFISARSLASLAALATELLTRSRPAGTWQGLSSSAWAHYVAQQRKWGCMLGPVSACAICTGVYLAMYSTPGWTWTCRPVRLA